MSFPILTIYLKTLDDNAFKKAAEFKEALKEFCTDDAKNHALETEISQWITSFCILYTELTIKIYRFEQKYNPTPADINGIENLVIIHSHVPERINLKIDNISRPVIKICHAYFRNDFRYLSIKPGVLGLKPEDYPDEISVCIQSHTVLRLKERIDSIHQAYAFLHLVLSFTKPEYYRNSEGVFFITYTLWNIKVGYLVADLHQNILLIRSFLFLTQDGTPEGQKLSNICRLGKLDKEYLALDRLSSFMTSKIRTNPELSALFTAAGCQGLLDICQVIAANLIKKSNPSIAEQLIEYLGLYSKHDFLTEEILPRKRIARSLQSWG